MNNAALIELHRGRRDPARELCELQLRWLHELARIHGAIPALQMAPQPWVNLGRLRRIARDHAGALGHFDLCMRTSAGTAVQLGPIAIDPPTWQAIGRAAPVRSMLEAVYVLDSFKTYLAAGDIEGGALRFLAQAQSSVGEPRQPMLAEAELMALASLERYEDALAVTERAAWTRSRYCMLLCATYRVALLAALGPSAQVRGLVDRLAGRILATSIEAPRDQRVVRYLHYLGTLAHRLDMHALARRLWDSGLHAASRIDDVPLQLAFLDSLLDIAGTEPGTDDRPRLARRRDQLLHECLYTTLLAPRGLQVDPEAAADPIFDALRHRLEDIAEHARRAAHGRRPPPPRDPSPETAMPPVS